MNGPAHARGTVACGMSEKRIHRQWHSLGYLHKSQRNKKRVEKFYRSFMGNIKRISGGFFCCCCSSSSCAPVNAQITYSSNLMRKIFQHELTFTAADLALNFTQEEVNKPAPSCFWLMASYTDGRDCWMPQCFELWPLSIGDLFIFSSVKQKPNAGMFYGTLWVSLAFGSIRSIENFNAIHSWIYIFFV